jgi:hypothetical protein
MNQPAFDHHYLPLDNAPTSKEECEELLILGSSEFRTKSGHVLIIRYLGPPTGVAVVTVTIPRAAGDHPSKSRWLQHIFETALTAIRLSYANDAEPLYTAKGFITMLTQTDNPEPEYAFPLQRRINADYRVDGANVARVFWEVYGPVKGAVASLLAEAQVPSLPPHYAVLSLTRAMELLWPADEDRYRELTMREADFAALKISDQPFKNALPRLRNRCAHGRGRGKDDPFIGIGMNDHNLRALRNLLTGIVADGLRHRFGVPVVIARDAE